MGGKKNRVGPKRNKKLEIEEETDENFLQELDDLVDKDDKTVDKGGKGEEDTDKPDFDEIDDAEFQQELRAFAKNQLSEDRPVINNHVRELFETVF